MSNVLETVKAEDFVEYHIFLGDDNSSSVQDVYNKVLTALGPLIEAYIWHKTEFNLTINNSDSGKSCTYCRCESFYGGLRCECVCRMFVENVPSSSLYGIVYYGDNVEDEWYTVYLLMKISELLPDVFIQ